MFFNRYFFFLNSWREANLDGFPYGAVTLFVFISVSDFVPGLHGVLTTVPFHPPKYLWQRPWHVTQQVPAEGYDVTAGHAWNNMACRMEECKDWVPRVNPQVSLCNSLLGIMLCRHDDKMMYVLLSKTCTPLYTFCWKSFAKISSRSTLVYTYSRCSLTITTL